jgi:hypothetical protein
MDIHSANRIVSCGFQYQAESNDLWRILDTTKPTFKGDCDDYALTVLWLICDRSIGELKNELLSGKAKLWFCDTPFGKHNMLEYKGSFCDNVERKWMSKKEYEQKGYKFIRSHSPWLVLYRLGFTAIFK